jgi:VanZ family protein
MRARALAAAPTGPHWFDGIVLALLVGILYASLARYGAVDCSRIAESFLTEGRSLSRADFAGNVFAYLLLGAALAFSWQVRQPVRSGRAGPARTPWGASVLAVGGCILLSLSMEATQACLTERVSSGWDLGTNSLGAALGWFGARAVYPAWNGVMRARGGTATQGRLLAVVLLAALAWLVATTAPWLPAFELEVLKRHVKAVLEALGGGYFDPWRLVGRGSEWLALGLALSLPLRRPILAFIPFCGLAAAAVGLRLSLVQGTGPSIEWLVTLPFVALALLGLALLGQRPRAVLVILAALVTMIAHQLEPGYGLPEPFRWRVMLLHGNAIAGIQIASYYAWFTMTVVAAGHALNGRALGWAVLPVLLLAVLEAVQTLIPGRTSDLSPPFVALACGALAAGMLGNSGTRPRRRR